MFSTDIGTLSMEQEGWGSWWENCNDPVEMLQQLTTVNYGDKSLITERQMRLFCAQVSWFNGWGYTRTNDHINLCNTTPNPYTQDSIEELGKTVLIEEVVLWYDWIKGEEGNDVESPYSSIRNWVRADPFYNPPSQVEKASMLREIIGNPYKPIKWSVCVSCEGTGWVDNYKYVSNDLDEYTRSWPRAYQPVKRVKKGRIVCSKCGPSPLIIETAREIYSSLSFRDSLPVLADMIVDFCYSRGHGVDEDSTLLTHLRDVGSDSNCVHLRGCWALDLLLGLK